jgi:hypothetical protein
MLAAAYAMSGCTLSPQYLSKKLPRVTAMRQIMPMSPVIAEYGIVTRQRRDCYGDVLLPDTCVRAAANFAIREERQNFLFEMPDEEKYLQIAAANSQVNLSLVARVFSTRADRVALRF